MYGSRFHAELGRQHQAPDMKVDANVSPRAKMIRIIAMPSADDVKRACASHDKSDRADSLVARLASSLAQVGAERDALLEENAELRRRLGGTSEGRAVALLGELSEIEHRFG